MSRPTLVVAMFVVVAVSMVALAIGWETVLDTRLSPYTRGVVTSGVLPASSAANVERSTRVRLESGAEVSAIVPADCDPVAGQTVMLLTVPAERRGGAPEYLVVSASSARAESGAAIR
ncbi:MAG: hypothetical protein LW860_06020 [Xanthomonadaceae bacterium]|jgi:ribosomal protein S12|nr:hypothetical protein [Xanthomonadaceae bacterium]